MYFTRKNTALRYNLEIKCTIPLIKTLFFALCPYKVGVGRKDHSPCFPAGALPPSTFPFTQNCIFQLCWFLYKKTEELLQVGCKEIDMTKKYSFEWREMHFAAGCPLGSRGCAHFFQLPPRQKNIWQATEWDLGKTLNVWWRLWNVSQLGRLDLHYFSLQTDFTLAHVSAVLEWTSRVQ